MQTTRKHCSFALLHRENRCFFIIWLWVYIHVYAKKHRACCHVTIMIVMLQTWCSCMCCTWGSSSINNCLYASVDTGTFQELLQLQLWWCIDVVCLAKKKKKCAEYGYCAMNFLCKIIQITQARVVAARHLDFVIWIWYMVVVDEVKNLTIKCWLRRVSYHTSHIA